MLKVGDRARYKPFTSEKETIYTIENIEGDYVTKVSFPFRGERGYSVGNWSKSSFILVVEGTIQERICYKIKQMDENRKKLGYKY